MIIESAMLFKSKHNETLARPKENPIALGYVSYLSTRTGGIPNPVQGNLPEPGRRDSLLIEPEKEYENTSEKRTPHKNSQKIIRLCPVSVCFISSSSLFFQFALYF